jgi:hypothetical protein
MPSWLCSDPEDQRHFLGKLGCNSYGKLGCNSYGKLGCNTYGKLESYSYGSLVPAAMERLGCNSC